SVHEVRRLERQQACLLDFDARLGNVGANRALVSKRLAERDTSGHAAAHRFERTLRRTDEPHAMVNSPGAEATLRDLETTSLAKQHIRRRDTHIFKDNLGVSMRRIVVAKYGQHPPDRNAGSIRRDEEHRLLLVPLRSGIGLSHEDRDLASRV